MGLQLPPEAQPDAAGVLSYSIICILASVLLFVLTWVHGERWSYVALLAIASGLNAAASTGRLINAMVYWRDIRRDMFQNAVRNYGNPTLVIFEAQTGAQLVLFCIQYYVLNVEAIITACWAIDLTIAIYQVRLEPSRHDMADRLAKAGAFILPAAQQGLLQLEAVQQRPVLFYVVANIIMGVGLLSGCFSLVPMLIRYVRARKRLSSIRAASGTLSTVNPNAKTYDNWLVIRFTFAFVVLALFEVVTIWYQVILAKVLSYTPLLIASGVTGPALTVAQARADVCSFPAGITISVVNFVVFGTTRTYRTYMWRTFVPRRLRALLPSGRRRRCGAVSVTASPSKRHGAAAPLGSASYHAGSRFDPDWCIAKADTLASPLSRRALARSDTDDLLILQHCDGSLSSDSDDLIILQRMESAKLRRKHIMVEDWFLPKSPWPDGHGAPGGREESRCA